MAKARYFEWLEPDGLLKLEAWARDGLTEEQIAHNMGIGSSTLRAWKTAHQAISAALKRGKEVADIEVENALYKKALGYNITIKKPFKVRTVNYEDGKRLKEVEKVIYADEEVHIPPDTTAQIFWLKNRKPGAWRDVKNNQIGLEKETLAAMKENVSLSDKLAVISAAKAMMSGGHEDDQNEE